MERMRADLSAAMKAGDKVAMRVLRATLAAIANAEAPPLDSAPMEVRGRLADLPRLTLTEDDIQRIVRAEIADREDTISRVREGGRPDDAAALEDELSILRRYLDN